MHPWVKGIEGPCLFPRGDNCGIAKIHWRNLTIFFSRTTEPILTKHGTMHPWVKGIQVCSNEGPPPFSWGYNYEIAKIHSIGRNWKKNLLLKNHWANFNQTWQSILCLRGIKFVLSGDNCEIAKIYWRNLKIFFSRTTGPISTKFGTKHSWVKGIQFCSNAVPHLFQGEIIIK